MHFDNCYKAFLHKTIVMFYWC